MPKYGQRLTTGDQNVETQVKFEAVKQVWILDVSLHHVAPQALLVFWLAIVVKTKAFSKFFVIIDEEDSPSLTRLARLYNHDGIITSLLLFHQIRLQFCQLLRQYPSFWKEAKVYWILGFHFFETRS